MKNKLWAYASILALMAAITANALANIIPFNGLTTGEISDKFPVYFVPAGYVFSIWGLIYVALACFVVYQALPKQLNSKLLAGVRPWFILSCLANGTWIFFWHYGLTKSSVLIMLVLLISLIMVYMKVHAALGLTHVQQWMIKAPFSLYLGWITVATIANITDALYAAGWGGWGIAPQVWAVIMLYVATAITLTFVFRNKDCMYALVIIWAFLGIAYKFQTVSIVFNTAMVVSALHLVPMLWIYVRRRHTVSEW